MLTALSGWVGGTVAYAAELTVAVLDRSYEPVPQVAVYAVPETTPAKMQTPHDAVIDQHDHAFVPHVLVVQIGTAVQFPNTDRVSHHVYSFSAAKRFELPLYRGDVHPPMIFDEPGVVTLGCNIHDGMLGFILVVETPHFALTNERGEVHFDDLPSGTYSLNVWTPRLRGSSLPLPRTVKLEPGGNSRARFAFEAKMFPPHDQREGSLSWRDYR